MIRHVKYSISRTEGILGKINVCRNVWDTLRHFHRLWQFFMTFVFYFLFSFFFSFFWRGGRGLENFLNLATRLFEDRYGLKQVICRVQCVQCGRKLTGYKWLKHRLENVPFSFLERVMGFREILSTILRFSNHPPLTVEMHREWVI